MIQSASQSSLSGRLAISLGSKIWGATSRMQKTGSVNFGSSSQILLKSPNGIMGKNLHHINSASLNSKTEVSLVMESDE